MLLNHTLRPRAVKTSRIIVEDRRMSPLIPPGSQERCLFSEACTFVDANSQCANGTCQCLEGMQSFDMGPCRSWASYAEPCNGLVDCVGEGVVCGPSVCVCGHGRIRVNDSCVIWPEEGLGDLNARQVRGIRTPSGC